MVTSGLLSSLLASWQQLLQPFGIPEAEVQATFKQIAAAYASQGRYYHTLEHVHHVLTTLETLKPYARNWSAVQFAAWLHDVVYDPQATDNEEKSAEYAHTLLQALSVPVEAIAITVRLILETKNHPVVRVDPDSQVLLDADLAILGTSPNHYQRYAEAIRQEYAWMPEPEYCRGRQRVLERFLQRQQIYWTPCLWAIAESQARQNLRAELKALARCA